MVKTAKHNRQEVIQKATDLFWEKGFHATSMRNLQDFVDMRPGSIYASFGSKEGLFKEVLKCYANASAARLEACIEASSSPLEALRTFFNLAVIDCREPSSGGMCMLVKTISELTDENADLQIEAKQLLGIVEDGFAVLLDQASACGELDSSKDPRRLARFLQMQLMGIRAYALANDETEQVNELIEDVFSSLR
ncbi:TetR/AcrR family transcriptional regulator [Motiliproteus sp. MSK22-1]|uniref:TetR/AcrR family transcriptional regulator n=1 Tax=Motiliproteus sp. MSK22-1 TaxID=1897630 RepID=UPI0009756AC6|nr:TetR/AcrR family transcriptional regulator [Motiliproteus sp. MSK22-1]OMH38921.1 TetR family transcriptional regulator [Motiliproteus sp. MSK22-1]